MKLYRPHIPLEVRCRVALRQAGYEETSAAIALAMNDGWLGTFLGTVLTQLACRFGCKVKDLRLDHDPPLGARKKRGQGKRTVYSPPANSPSHLLYRPHGTQFEWSHDVKTRIRGDHGQYSDIVLIKRERLRKRKLEKQKYNWHPRPLKSASRWPPKGSRKIGKAR